MGVMKPEPSIFDEVDAAWEAEKDARGMADFEAGRVVSHEAVRRWLLSWGTPNELPSPECGE